MTTLPYFHIDAFASRPFQGNQAAVMPMESFPSDDILQAIAAENLFAETAYIVRTSDDSWDLRWFTPTVEVPLCGTRRWRRRMSCSTIWAMTKSTSISTRASQVA